MRDENSGWIQLSSAEFFLLWSFAELGEFPVPLNVAHVGRTEAHRARLVEEASRTLTERGLGTVHAPARDLGIYLRLLADHKLSVDLHAEGQGAGLRAMTVSGSSGVAGAAIVGNEVRIGPVGDHGMISALLAALPELPAGNGMGANVRWDDYLRACAEGDRHGVSGFVEILRDSGVRGAEANTIATAVSERVGGGRLGCSVRGVRGRARTPHTVNWVDTPHGRYSVRRGGDWVMVTPVSTNQLRAMAEEMVDDLR
ncbi:ESAT-6 protein secretion system EspG family protein [Tamaricihabitans halophyticus]|uniref:ESAT-6 protein secretion system EspG family protein n=1 Tax=Tamaricihabitans halophyticus TaxID=1262583 RepID=A0A4R2QYZ4_9PSEU|nr:ESX secretion-associated protein EspG [Tamaricihabitans halophyticus]TCP54298.1 ESAT-6 protein secretion system EspG family protein [Tamaricihabitans halophyticus]